MRGVRRMAETDVDGESDVGRGRVRGGGVMKRTGDYLKNCDAVTEGRHRAEERFPPDGIRDHIADEFHHFLLLLCVDYIDEKTFAEEVEHALALMQKNRDDDRRAREARSTGPQAAQD